MKDRKDSSARLKPGSRKEVLRDILAKIPEIDAVFLLTDDTSIVHVFSVVSEFQEKMYDKLLKKERQIERDFPEVAFEFHVRAHQGRSANEAVPFDAELVFAR